MCTGRLERERVDLDLNRHPSIIKRLKEWELKEGKEKAFVSLCIVEPFAKALTVDPSVSSIYFRGITII